MKPKEHIMIMIKKLVIIFCRAFLVKAGIGLLKSKLNPTVWIKTYKEWFKFGFVATYFSALFMVSKLIL